MNSTNAFSNLFARSIAIGSFGIISVFAGSAMAQSAPVAKDPTATPRIDQRQQNQAARIDQGVKSGQLTSQEQANLQKREDKIAADKAAAKADGKVTRKERARLTREENKASGAIYRKKHNGKKATQPAA